ncbi:MAG: alpha/beta fold hydrolase [Flavobacteriaceae bacterium]
MTTPFALEAGQGPTLLFLHGWTMESGLFRDQFARLSGRFHCIAPDLPGHGEALGIEPTVASAAELVHRLIEDRDLSAVTLVGWSLGATVAWTYLDRYGDRRVRGLVSVDMSPKIVNEGGWTLGMKGQTREKMRHNAARFEKDWAAAAPAIAAGMFADRKGPPLFGFDDAVEQIRSSDPQAMNAMWASLSSADCRAMVGGISVPFLVTHGARSRVYSPRTAEWLVAAAPRALLHSFPAAGHAPHLEEPESFATLIGDFACS